MTNFVRPEVRAGLWRWREALAGSVLCAFGLLWLTGASGFIFLLGGVLATLGAMLCFIGIQRGRFRGRSGGPGTVDVDEGQVTYFGPLTGGAVALRDLEELALIRSRQTPHWRLSTADKDIFIPVNADGTEALFDAFTVLPGLKVQRMLAALQDSGGQDTVIWCREPARPVTLRLH